jgi:hypothetical protein
MSCVADTFCEEGTDIYSEQNFFFLLDRIQRENRERPINVKMGLKNEDCSQISTTATNRFASWITDLTRPTLPDSSMDSGSFKQ